MGIYGRLRRGWHLEEACKVLMDDRDIGLGLQGWLP
jgi:hypothetical protein